MSSADLFRSREWICINGRDAPSKRDRSLWACPRTEHRQVFRSSLPLLLPLRLLFSSLFVEIVLSRLCAHVLYCFVSRAHLSDSGARQSAKDAGSSLSLSLDPSVLLRAPRNSFSRRVHSLFFRARIRGHGPRAGAQNRGSTRERPDARRLTTRIRSCAHEPLRKSSLAMDAPFLRRTRNSIFVTESPCVVATHRDDGDHVKNWSYRKKWLSFANKSRDLHVRLVLLITSFFLQATINDAARGIVK